jgi:hypothetical protein
MDRRGSISFHTILVCNNISVTSDMQMFLLYHSGDVILVKQFFMSVI